MDYADRRRRLLRAIKAQSLPGLLVTNETNVSYLTGFTGDSSYLYLTPTDTVMISDARYSEQLESECPDLQVEIRSITTKLPEATANVLTAAKARQVALEAGSVTWDFANTLKSHDKLKEVEFVPTSGLV